MKKLILMIIIATSFIACTDNGKLNDKELEVAGKDLQKTVQKGVDTVGSKLKKLKNKIDDRVDTLNNN